MRVLSRNLAVFALALLIASLFAPVVQAQQATPSPGPAPETQAEVPNEAPPTSRPAAWRYIHPAAKVLAGVDLQALLTSPLGQRLRQELDQSGMMKMARTEDLSFLTAVERLLISSPGDLAGARAKAKTDDTPLLITLQGRFDLAAIRKTLIGKGARAATFRGFDLLVPDGKKSNMSLALISSRTLLLGDPASLRAGMGPQAAAVALQEDHPLLSRAAALNRVHDIWFVSEGSPASLAAEAPQAQIFRDVESVEGGLSLRKGLDLAFVLNTKDEASAKLLGTALQGLAGLAAMSAKDAPEAASLLQKFSVMLSGEQVQVSISYTMAELDRGIASWKARGLGEVVAKKSPAPTPDAPLAKPTVLNAGIVNRGSAAPVVSASKNSLVANVSSGPAGGGNVRIYNLGGGTRSLAMPR